MEFTNEIFFNKKLVQNETVLITYSGKLYKEYSAEITIVYGFGENWDYTQEAKMQEKENGFEVSIDLKNYDTFNFCFRNNFNIWDNNSGFNYIASVEPAKLEEPEIINEEQSTNTSEIVSQENIEEAFDILLNSIMDFKIDEVNTNVNLENGFGLQSVDEIKETDFTSCDDIFKDLYNELAEITTPADDSNIQNIIFENSATSANKEISNLEALLNDFSERQEEKNKLITSEELENIIDNVLNSIIEDDLNKENNIKFEKFEVSDLPAKQETSLSVENLIDKCIDGTSYFLRNIWNSCKKIGVLIKDAVKNLVSEKE